jgi:DNA-binding IclR family transcriptional regulator
VSQSLGRALQILVRLADAPATLDELAVELGVHKTTVLRLLRTLAESHFVFRDDRRRYHLGARIHELSSLGLDQREVRALAAPHLVAFNREHGRTTHLCELAGDEIVYIDKIESHDHVRMASRIGLRAPVHSTASGKALVADLPPAALDELLHRISLTAATPRTITDPRAFRTELAAVRGRGWASDIEENEHAINCIAAPIRDASGRTVAAISVSVPDIVLDYPGLRELVPDLLAVADRVSRSCGWRPRTGPSATSDHPSDTAKG